MDFDPNNHVIRLCMQAMEREARGEPDEADGLFSQAWREATNDFERFMAAHFVARRQKSVSERLRWLETALRCALAVNDESVAAAFPSLYGSIASCFEESGDHENAARNRELARSSAERPPDRGPFYHGTRANLRAGDLLTAGFNSNYKADFLMNHVYFTALARGAGLAAALAKGEGPERVYVVEPTGTFENDPNVTDKKFPGNPTRSYRTQAPLKIVGEVTEWEKQKPEDLAKFREKLANNKGEIIN